jgi:FkbM family methyltransferase
MRTDIEQDLKRDLWEVLNQEAETVSRRMREEYDRMAGRKAESIVLCGAGVVGKLALQGLRRAGIEPRAFMDNNPLLWNSVVDGVCVHSAAEAVRKFGADCAFIVTIYHGSAVREQLRSLSCATVIPFDRLFMKYSNILLPHMSLDLPDEIFRQAPLVEAAFELWDDNESRAEYVAQLRYRTSLDYRWTQEYSPAEDTYFPGGLAQISDDEVFVDCGAFDGDSLQEFLKRCHGTFQAVLALEPDAGTFLRLRHYVESLPVEIQKRIHTLNVALGRVEQTVSFQATGTVYSRVTAGADSIQVACETLDRLLAGYDKPYIKMDIEGAELDALDGAKRTLETGRATLAICNHHTQDDLWKIPLAINELSGGAYNLYLRRNAEDCWENMCHAIPKRRQNGRS